MGDIHWLEFPLLQGMKLRHAVFSRRGGVSVGDFASLNLSATVGDKAEAVEENRKRAAVAFGCKYFIFPRQVHGIGIELVSGDFACSQDCDGLITKETGQPLTILHADCQAAIFYDPIKHTVANIHCGWRGNVQNIYEKTVDRFKDLGSNPSDLLVCISPSLGPDKAEFIRFETEFPESFYEFRRKGCYFDLWEISRFQLEKAGVLRGHIEIAKRCTYENETEYFSYRRKNKAGQNRGGRQGTVVSLL